LRTTAIGGAPTDGASKDAARFWTPKEQPLLPAIEGVDKDLSQSFIKLYSTGGNKTWLKNALERGAPYMAFIKEEIRAAGTPEEFLYLPVIESAFEPTAVSSSGAAGLWQFMTNSIAPWLKITAEIDERLDFWASTKAALAKLKANYDETHDWAMALAAYNSGLGAVRRLRTQNPGKSYWELADMKALKAETLRYVPKLLAVYYIASNPRRMGFEDFWPEAVAWEEVPLERQVGLRALAQAAGLDFAALRAANAGLKFGIMPSSYKLKLRAEHKESVALAMSDTVPLTQSYIHIIEKGDTVYALSRSYGVAAARILEANPGIDAWSLKIGKPLFIP
jgi:membrane-bound lytic murein transglycosylase D